MRLPKPRTIGQRAFWGSLSGVVLAGVFSALLLYSLTLVSHPVPGVLSTKVVDIRIHSLAHDIGKEWNTPQKWPALIHHKLSAPELNMVKVTIITTDGRVLWSDSALPKILGAGSDGKIEYNRFINLLAGKMSPENPNWPHVEAPITSPKGTVGVIVGDIRDIARYQRNGVSGYLVMGTTMFTTIIACLLVSAYLAFGIKKSLTGLKTAIEAMAAGDYNSRLPLNTLDEVSQVASAFNVMADRLEEARRQEKQLESLKRDLITNVSHDLRGPLTSVQGYLEALEDGLAKNPETSLRYIGIIRKKAVQLSNLVTDLLDYSRLESGNLPMRLKEVELADWLRESLALAEPDISAAGIELDAEIPETAGRYRIDSNKMNQVITNLVQNALRYAPKGSTIYVSLDRSGTVSIKDEGPGIKDEDLPHLFQRFYRGRDQADGIGTGLGLAIAAQIIWAHKGRIWAENNRDGGASFSFQLRKL